MQAQPTAGSRDRAGEALADVLAIINDPEQLAQDVALATIAAVLNPDAPCRRWSLSNRLLMLRAGTFDARGFKQWKDTGRSVVKGARAFYILAPRTVSKSEIDAVTGEERKRTILVGFVAIPVFPYQATDGADIGYPDSFEPSQIPPLLDVAERLGVSVKWVPTVVTHAEQALGWYQHSSRSIVLGVEDATVFFHELAHAAHYAAGLADKRDSKRKELVAETVAAALCKMYGHPVTQRHRRYLEQHADERDAQKAALAVLHDIEATLDVIFPREQA